MRPTCRVLGLIALSLFISGPRIETSTTAQGMSTFGYAYATQENPGEYLVYVIDPIHPNERAESFVLPLPEQYSYIAAKPSPNGQWLAVTFASIEIPAQLIQMINIVTGESRQVAQLAYRESFDSNTLPQWSPDNRYLAFTGRYFDNESWGIYLYSLENGHTTTALTAQTAESLFHFAWTSDSQRLAVSFENCSVATGCPLAMVAYTIPGEALQVGPELVPGIRGTACDLKWSPDGRFVSFQAMCDGPNRHLLREIFVWDTFQNRIIQLTHYTSPIPINSPGPLLFASNYGSAWYDDNNLLLGAIVAGAVPGEGVEPENLLVETVLYRVPGDGMQILLPLEGAFGITVNPASWLIAYHAETEVVNDGILDRQQTAVRISAFDGDTLDTLVDAPPGCDLNWSPDGQMLGYAAFASWSVNTDVSCDSGLRNFVFVDVAGGQVREFPLPASQTAVENIGWVSVD